MLSAAAPMARLLVSDMLLTTRLFSTHMLVPVINIMIVPSATMVVMADIPLVLDIR